MIPYASLMAGGRIARASPVELAPAGWPAGPSEDPHVELARLFNLRLRAAIGLQSARSVALAAGITHTALNRILAGETWPDMLSISKLEWSLGVDLWPGHRR